MSNITTQEKLDQLADHAIHREYEVHGYQTNIDNYTAILASLPQGDPPAGVAQYIGTDPSTWPYDLPVETINAVADFQQRERLRFLLRTERIEQRKSQQVLDAVTGQIPQGQRSDLLAQAKARRAAALAAAQA